VDRQDLLEAEYQGHQAQLVVVLLVRQDLVVLRDLREPLAQTTMKS